MRRNIWTLSVPWILAIAVIALGGCGGGDSAPAPAVPTATIQGSVSGTIIMAIDNTGKIAAQDDTAGKTPLPGSSPPKYPFSLTVPTGYLYTIQFIVNEGTATEKILPLSVGGGNIFSVASTGTLDLGFVDTSGTEVAVPADNNNLPPPIGTTPPPTININMDNGYRYFYTRNGPDGSVTAKFNVEVRDPIDNTPVTARSRIKDVAFFDNAWNSLPLSGPFVLFNGTSIYRGYPSNTPLPFQQPSADVDGVLVQAPSGLAEGFYNVTVTDNAGNLHKAQVYFRQPDAVAKPVLHPQATNDDNSITLSWTNPTFPSGKTYSVRLVVLSEDLNGDTEGDWQLLVIGNQQFESYTIPAGFVSSNLAGKIGLKWHVQIRQYDDTIVFPDGRSLATAGTQFAQIYRNISEEKVLTLPAVSFTQADLTGTWDMMQFKTSSQTPFGGWFRVVVDFKDNGAVFIPDNSTFQSTVADDSVSNGDQGIVWTINSAGRITETGDPTSENFHGNMASNKQLIVATITLKDQSGNPTGKAIRILRKRVPGVTYGIADLAKPFVYHSMESGAFSGWGYGAGTIDGSGDIHLTSQFDDVGPLDPAPDPAGQFTIDTVTGVVSESGRGYKGFITPDKTTVFLVTTLIEGTSTSYELLTLSLNPAKTFALLEGTYRFHAIWTGTSGWAHGTLAMSSTGDGTILGITTSEGNLSGGSVTLSILSDGTVEWTGDPIFRGTLSSNGSLMIGTSTDSWGFGEQSLEFYVK
jgi:hypothetical protein